MKAALPILLLAAAPVSADDSSGFDPAAIEQCLNDGSATSCVDARIKTCHAHVAGNRPVVAAIDRQLGCLDASRGAWEAHLGRVYDQVIDLVAVQDAATEDALRRMEGAWTGLCDARCRFDRLPFGGGTGRALKEPRCLRDGTARQAALVAHRLTVLHHEPHSRRTEI